MAGLTNIWADSLQAFRSYMGFNLEGTFCSKFLHPSFSLMNVSIFGETISLSLETVAPIWCTEQCFYGPPCTNMRTKHS